MSLECFHCRGSHLLGVGVVARSCFPSLSNLSFVVLPLSLLISRFLGALFARATTILDFGVCARAQTGRVGPRAERGKVVTTTAASPCEKMERRYLAPTPDHCAPSRIPAAFPAALHLSRDHRVVLSSCFPFPPCSLFVQCRADMLWFSGDDAVVEPSSCSVVFFYRDDCRRRSFFDFVLLGVRVRLLLLFRRRRRLCRLSLRAFVLMTCTIAYKVRLLLLSLSTRGEIRRSN